MGELRGWWAIADWIAIVNYTIFVNGLPDTWYMEVYEDATDATEVTVAMPTATADTMTVEAGDG